MTEFLRGRVKAELRKRMRGLRKALPASACAARSEKIATRLASLEAVAQARAVALFWPIEERHEVDLRPLDAILRQRGVRVAYPAIDPDAGAMTFRFVDRVAGVEPRGLGFSEPSSSEPEAGPGDLDIIVVPALAIDPRGHRIGYGAGHYDRTLPRFSPPAVTVAVAFDFQLIAEVPEMPGDVRVAFCVTDARSFAASAME
ncbi:MAG: 5-formyltetrahydrofolate cyclo-ligase [Polyangiaceae bacterium]